VSNTAGTDSDKHQAEAGILEKNTGVKVLRHSTKVDPLPLKAVKISNILRNLAVKPR
jgi:hypothetical protein